MRSRCGRRIESILDEKARDWRSIREAFGAGENPGEGVTFVSLDSSTGVVEELDRPSTRRGTGNAICIIYNAIDAISLITLMKQFKVVLIDPCSSTLSSTFDQTSNLFYRRLLFPMGLRFAAS